MATTETTELTIEPGSSLFTTERIFNAPAEKVFRAVTDPELIAQWWGPAIYENVIEEYEPRRGGRWRFVQKGPDGSEHGFHGVIHELTPNERVVQTFEYEGAPGHPVLEQMVLVEEDGRTRMLNRSAFLSVEDRDAMVGSGMEGGLRESHDRLRSCSTESDLGALRRR
jgi:uncharacterized protein YndB with AHSA1/START domain